MLLSLIIPSLSFVNAESTSGTSTKKGPALEARVENREQRVTGIMNRASSTENRLENRQNNIERIRARIASTTASTTASSTKRLEKLDNRLQKQEEQMTKVKDRLLNRELKVTEVLGKIADKIQARIDILVAKGLDLTAAKAKLAEANAKVQEMVAEENVLSSLASTTVTEANKDQLFKDIKTSQDKIKTLAFASHALLVDTVKEITKILPKNGQTTTTATTTN